MRKVLFAVWLVLPGAAAAYHFGPGQDRWRVDQAAVLVVKAEESAAQARDVAAREGDAAARDLWAAAEEGFGQALELLPGDKVGAIRSVRLERAKAQMFLSQLPAARQDLESLVDEMEADAGSDGHVLAGARSALSTARYYTTWLMRLEGAPRDEWEPEIDAARQTYKLLSEQSSSAGDAAGAKESQENLEASIRLSRLELSDLQGLPIPSQCRGCCSCRGRGPSKKGKGKQGLKPQDARGAGSGPPPDGSGS